MADQYTSERKVLGTLLSTSSREIEVPDYQRDFSWDTPQFEAFWKDLLAFSAKYPGENILAQEYFLGTMVIVDTEGKYYLLDGQQRLATATIVLSVIRRDFVKPYDTNASTRTSERYIVGFDDPTQKTKHTLTLNRYDRDFFRREIQQSRDGTYVEPIPALESHKLIRKGRQYFGRMFQEDSASLALPSDKFAWAMRIQRVLTNHISLIAVTSNDEDNAATVFETLNDRGIGLSTPDLLRNFLLRGAPENDREAILESWRTVLQVAEGGDVDIFLRHFWVSRKGDVTGRSLYREIKEKFVGPSIKFAQELEVEADIYKDILMARHDNAEIRRYLEAINLLNARAFYPVVLSLLSVSGISDEDKVLLLQDLTTMFVRHNIICKRDNAVLEKLAFQCAKNVRDSRSTIQARQDIRKGAPSDDEFRKLFATADVERSNIARYLLREIEGRKRKTGEMEVAAPNRTHVEHIYPQRPLDGFKWANHNDAVNRLGNQTLLSRRLNVRIKNALFPDKKPSYATSDLLITKELGDVTEWSMTAIDNRQKALAEIAAEIWRF